MKFPPLLLASLLLLQIGYAAPPAFRATSIPEGWTLVRGEVDPGSVRSAKPLVPVELRTTEPIALPMEAKFLFRAAQGDAVTFSLTEKPKDGADPKDKKDATPPLLACSFRPTAATQATVTAHASGEPMATTIVSSRAYSGVHKNTGSLVYGWRFPKVKNLWDEQDRKEIGAAYAKLVPFEEKTFAIRFTLTETSRQIWLDDRLVAEARMNSPKEAYLSIQLTKGAQVLSTEFSERATPATPSTELLGLVAGSPRDPGPQFVPLSLSHYSHAKQVQPATAASNALPRQHVVTAINPPRPEQDSTSPRRGPYTINDIPFLLSQTHPAEVNLGDSVDRYRSTKGSGPDASYVNAQHAWPDAFALDPASLTFRVPYRTYRHVWLLTWIDETPNCVPKGAFRFFRPGAGYPAATEFEITKEAIDSGMVLALRDKTPGGKQLYLVCVPVNMEEFYGFRDMADQFLEFELSKPVGLARSYPDPIYYGYHPAGLPSSIHVVGITLEQAPFSYEVITSKAGFVFEQPEQPAFTVAVTNTSAQAFSAHIAIRSRSFDGNWENGDGVTQETASTEEIPPGKTRQVTVKLTLEKLGWHELRFDVDMFEFGCGTTLSAVLLPPNSRTYGDAPNENRFGTWNLLGHYTPVAAHEDNGPQLAMFRKLGLRKIDIHEAFVTAETANKYDFLPKGPHTIINVVYRWKQGDVEGQKKMIETEVAAAEKLTHSAAVPTYYYGGEWHVGRMAQYAPLPFYTGDGDPGLSEEENFNAGFQIPIFTKIGAAIHEKFPQVKRLLQWGAPLGSLAYMRAGLSKDVVDGYGMDAPMFELLPESSNTTGSINQLWMLRAEAKRLGWPKLPIHWAEGPFFPTNPGALTEEDQMNYQVRYLLLGMSYGIDDFEAGIVPYDAGNYYGAEHYGAGIFHRTPLENPKPAVAAVATMTSMLCGADPTGGIDTGSLTTYCMGFQRAKDKAKIFALWRVTGKSTALIKVRGTGATITDAMGNATKPPIVDGAIAVPLSSTPVWLTGVEEIEGFTLDAPTYDSAPAKVTRSLAEMDAKTWVYEGSEDKAYAYNHFSVRRIPDPQLTAEFGQGEDAHADAVAITLPVEPGDRPLATRYGALKLKKPVTIPGKASAVGLWVKGNSSWGRVIYQLKDAKGEIWTSTGSKDDWNCDDTHGWSSINFDGWRYVRFPLPGTHPYDNARELETTWWGSRGGDGVVDLPLTLEKIIVEARNEVPVLGEMKLVPERSYKLSHLVAEYEAEENATVAILAKYKLRMPAPVWTGPTENLFAKLTAEGAAAAPALGEFTEPTHFNDGRRMIAHFEEAAGLKYNLYLSIYPDGRGADLIKAGVKAGEQVTGLKPEIPMYLFLTSVGADKKESKPSQPIKLITHDNFAEK